MLPTSQTSPVPTQRCLIPINIETLAGSSFELLVSPYEQIQYIKRKIERREGIPVSHQHLVWKSNELDDESCLHDYKIEAGTTIKLVLAMRGGPVNTKRVPIEDSFIRDMSEYIESNRDDCTISSDLLPSSSASNKNVTFLVLRDGDQFNFFQVIDRGDGTLSPLSGSISNASMYNAHEATTTATTIEPEREYNEKRLDDDRKTKQKMELLRSKLKTHARKDVPSLASNQSKSNLVHHHRRNLLVDASSTLSTNGDNSSGTSSLEQQQQQQQQQQQSQRSIAYQFSSNHPFSRYDIFTTGAIRRPDYLHEEDSEDDDDSHDEDDDQQQQKSQILPSLTSPPPPPPPSLKPINNKNQQLLTGRSYSPSVFYQKKHQHYETTESTKKSIYHSHHYQDRTSKNILGQHDSTSTLGTYAQNSINTMLTTSYPSVTLGPVSQETALTTTSTSSTSGNDTSTGAVLVDYIPRISPTLHQQQVPIVSTSSRLLSATMSKHLSTTDQPTTNTDCPLTIQDEKISSNSEIVYQQSHSSPMLELIDDDILSPTNGLISATSKPESYRKQTGEIQSRNDTSLSKPMWTDDDDQLIIGDEFTSGERTSTSQSMLFRHRNSSTSTTVVTPVPTFPSVVKKSTLPSTTQQFYHRHKPLNTDQQTMKPSPRPLIPLSLSKYRRIPANVHLTATNTSNEPTSTNNNNNNTPDSLNDYLMINKPIELLKTPSKQQSSTTTVLPPPKKQQDSKSTGATSSTVPPPPSTSSSSSLNPLDNTKVTIGKSFVFIISKSCFIHRLNSVETIGPKAVTALLRQNATIEPVDTSRGVGKHLVSLLTTASKDTTSIKTGYKQSSRDVVIEERYKVKTKSNIFDRKFIDLF